MPFPGAVPASIQYLINPAYYADMVAGNSLAAYTTWGVASYTTAAVTDVLGSTGWSMRTYTDGSTGRATFVWNTTTNEVIFYPAYTTPDIWNADDVLAAFATDAETSFFAAISKSRSSLYSTAPPSTAVGSVQAGWSQYHDSLVRQLESIQDKYAWQDDADLVARVDAITAELQAVGSTIMSSPLGIMLDDFDRAYEDAKSANLERYEQLTADAETATPNPWVVMSYPQLAKYMIDVHFDALDAGYADLEAVREVADDDALTAIDEDWDEIDDRYGQIGDQARSDIDDRFSAALTAAQQGLIDSGMYNTILNAAAISGAGAAHAAELARLGETLGMPQIQSLQQIKAMKTQERRQATQNRLTVAQASLAWAAERARRLSELYRLGALVVENRIDVGPQLSDIANLTMNIGKGQGSQQMLGNFQTSQIFALAGLTGQAVAKSTGESK